MPLAEAARAQQLVTPCGHLTTGNNSPVLKARHCLQELYERRWKGVKLDNFVAWLRKVASHVKDNARALRQLVSLSVRQVLGTDGTLRYSCMGASITFGAITREACRCNFDLFLEVLEWNFAHVLFCIFENVAPFITMLASHPRQDRC